MNTGVHQASITVRNLNAALKERLRVQAAQHGHSMEAEARRILQTALTLPAGQPARHLYDRIRARFTPLGEADLELPPTRTSSAMMSNAPSPRIGNRLRGQPSEALFTAAVCQAEILSRIAILPNGRRRADLEQAANAMFADDLQDRVLPFDSDAAIAYADLFAARRKAGRPPARSISCWLRSHACGAPVSSPTTSPTSKASA